MCVHFLFYSLTLCIFWRLFILSCSMSSPGHCCCFQSLSHIWLFVTPWTAARQAFLSFTISKSLLKFMSVESVMPSNHFIICCPLLILPSICHSIRVFSNKLALHIRWLSIRASALASILPVNIQDWFPLGLTGLSVILSKGLSRVFSNTTVQKHQVFSAQPSLYPNLHIHLYIICT